MDCLKRFQVKNFILTQLCLFKFWVNILRSRSKHDVIGDLVLLTQGKEDPCHHQVGLREVHRVGGQGDCPG